ncbi:TIGR03088 family PEP-CTERM/XrtA system glycosyltransferase [Seongchinamella sediminis]|uniref:TIGR03088 family PEP-CTERM/XrtA system glycosyltransferase n=1 Tax=Seongchinamella sediminis TaxID=2283635 RepID=A0A3L7DUG9_9GAMM|nr:TIGR03088 family PEP-CTERM/XrtA system glycosyltransferase [Seongchinamella sediminis]RLQ20756.1 TIGR03088 family PEP-CTERM/XrtA system glycosyltransferase [Seongchinamella sediminis]
MPVAANSQKPPLVAHVIYALGTGGLENGLVNIINRCPSDRYRHAIICLTTADAFVGRLAAPDVEVIELHKRPGHDPAMYLGLWRTLRRLRPAIVHTRNLAALETQVLGLLFPRCKRVHGEHGRDVSDLDGSNSRYRRLRCLLSPLIHRFITVSQDLAQWLVAEVGIAQDKVTHIYNGVDRSRFTARIGSDTDKAIAVPRRSLAGMPADFLVDSDCRVVGTVGRLAAVKDQQALICAMAHIFSESPPLRQTLRCILVGEGPERIELASAITRHGLEANVWLAGDRDDIPDLLACMDVFVLPSLGEGISNTVLEAMATGLPVIATRVGGNPELVQQGVSGLLVPVADVPALAAAIAALVDDPVRCEQMGQAAVQRVTRDFDWERTVSAYLGVYDELLGRSQPAGQMERA